MRRYTRGDIGDETNFPPICAQVARPAVSEYRPRHLRLLHVQFTAADCLGLSSLVAAASAAHWLAGRLGENAVVHDVVDVARCMLCIARCRVALGEEAVGKSRKVVKPRVVDPAALK